MKPVERETVLRARHVLGKVCLGQISWQVKVDADDQVFWQVYDQVGRQVMDFLMDQICEDIP